MPSSIRHNKNRRHRPPVDWEKLRLAVMIRDIAIVIRTLEERGFKPTDVAWLPCPGWVMDPSSGPEGCAPQGSWKLDHVKAEPRLGMKAEDTIDRLVSLCGTHDERGMIAGFIWNTANREREREYLNAREEERVDAVLAD